MAADVSLVAQTLDHVWVVQLERWALGADAWHRGEVVAWRWAGSCPLQRVAVTPWVVDGHDLAVTVGLEDVPHEWDDGDCQDTSADGGYLVVDREAVGWQVVSVTTWHTCVTCPVLNQEGGVEADHGEPEVQLAQLLVQHASGHLGEPEVDTSEGCEGHGTEQGVVEVCNHEVGIGDVEVQSWGGQHDTGQATEEEGGEEADGEDHRGLEGQATAPHGAKPVEELHTGWNTDEEGHEGEEWQQDGAGDEHVVSPHGHGQSGDGQRCEDQADVAEHWLAGEHWEDFGNDAEEWQREDVHLWVAEEPEEVLPQDGATVSRIVDVATELAVVQNTQGGSSQQWEDQQN